MCGRGVGGPMTPVSFALVERLHGHLGWLGLAVLAHPLLVLLRGRPVTRGTRLSAVIATALVVLPYALGWAIYPTYRTHIKPALIAAQLPVALRFESKEHLALFTVVFAVSGLATLLVSKRPEARRLATVLIGLGWVCGVLTGVLGIWVAAHAHGGW